jgi:recombination protein RecR
MVYTRPLAKLIAELEKLPGVGPKSAQRLAFHFLKSPKGESKALADALLEVTEKVRECSICFNYTTEDVCEICSDPARDQGLLCVVAEPRDLMAMERTQEYRGVYHVLGGVLSPLDGITPDMLRLRELEQRLKERPVKEVIIATNPTVEGNATAIYISGLVKPTGVKVTRIAHGLPVGGDMDYADQATLVQALEWRREL